MKIRQIIILGLMVLGLGLLRPGSVFAGYACIEGDPCNGTTVVDVPYGCLPSSYGEWCETRYPHDPYIMDCDSECRYPRSSYGTECGGPGWPSCGTVPAYIGPGTCCASDAGGGGGGCETTAPINLAVNWNYSADQTNITWWPGGNGTRQLLKASDNPMAIANNCSGEFADDCVINEWNLPTSQTAYQANKIDFTVGNIYWFKVINFAPASCSKSMTINSTYTVTIPTPSTCSVSVNPLSVVSPSGTQVTYSGTVDSTSLTQNIKLWLERRDSQQIPGGASSLTTSDGGGIWEGEYDGRYYYEVARCPANPGETCTENPTITAPAGEYYFHCDVSADPGRCSGNPFCWYEGGSLACTGWKSCSDLDNSPFDVTCDPNDWGVGWSACNATCGGGTQTRTNACGTIESQACNTQACAADAWWQAKDGNIHADGGL